MGTPRPTISVDNLNVNKRSWPEHKLGQDYEKGGRYGFRIGKIEYQLWKWPWPEWIGLPSKETLDVWFDLIDDWKTNNKGKYSEDHIDKCIRCMMPYL